MKLGAKFTIFFLGDSNEILPIMLRDGLKNIYSSACDTQGPYE